MTPRTSPLNWALPLAAGLAACGGAPRERASITPPAAPAPARAPAPAPAGSEFPESVRLRPALAPGSVLAALEVFEAPPYPRGGREMYTVRFDQPFFARLQPDGSLKLFPAAVPDSWPATLVCDLWWRFNDGDVAPRGLDIRVATAAQIAAAIEFYVTKDWENIRGYRPWTHSKFIGQLSPSDRARLADEIVAFVARERKRTSLEHATYCPP